MPYQIYFEDELPAGKKTYSHLSLSGDYKWGIGGWGAVVCGGGGGWATHLTFLLQ